MYWADRVCFLSVMSHVARLRASIDDREHSVNMQRNLCADIARVLSDCHVLKNNARNNAQRI